MKTCRWVAVVVLALAFSLAGFQRPASAQTPTTIELSLDRPVWQVGDEMVVTGRVETPTGPLADVEVQIGVNDQVNDLPRALATGQDGTFRVLVAVEEHWGFGTSSMVALFAGDDDNAGSDAMILFQVAPREVTPVAFAVDPPPTDAGSPGQELTLSGSLQTDHNEPAVGQSVFAVVDAGTDHHAFGRVDEQGRWRIEFTIPTTPGEWSEQFPSYRIPVVFEGDWTLAPAQHDVVLTLDRAPVEEPLRPTLVHHAPHSVPAPTASPTPVMTPTPRSEAAPATSTLPVWLPNWAGSPAFLVGSAGVLSLLVGAALLSHARRG